MTQSRHIPVLDHLRGIAAIAVCLFHFSCGNGDLLSDDDPVKVLGTFGSLGVEAFFVISGFVIPYSLHLRSYRLADSPSFFARRLKRLEPPYFACIIVVIILHQLSAWAPGFRGNALNLTWQQLLAHLGYLNAILEYGWLNPVFWTLAIEFQYYIFIALVFPVLVHANSVIRHLAVLAVALLGLTGLGNFALLPFWLPLFAIGMATFQFYTNQVSARWYAVLLITVFLLSCYLVGSQHSVVGICTALTIVAASSRELPRIFAPFAFLGTISYSLYLLHTPIGGRIVNLSTRLPELGIYRYSAIVVAFVVSVLCAYAFWQIVERPSQRWSKSPSTDAKAKQSEEQIKD